MIETTYTILSKTKIERGWLMEVLVDDATGFADFAGQTLRFGLAPGTKVDIAGEKVVMRLLNSGEWAIYDNYSGVTDEEAEAAMVESILAALVDDDEIDLPVTDNAETVTEPDETAADEGETVTEPGTDSDSTITEGGDA